MDLTIRARSKLFTICQFYSKNGNYDKSLRLSERVLAVRRKNHGPDHPDTLKTEDHLVNTLCKLGT